MPHGRSRSDRSQIKATCSSPEGRPAGVAGADFWLTALLPARSSEVGVVTEMLLTKAEQVSDDGRAPPDYA